MIRSIAEAYLLKGSGFGGRPKGRGGMFLVGYFQNRAYFLRFLQITNPCFK